MSKRGFLATLHLPCALQHPHPPTHGPRLSRMSQQQASACATRGMSGLGPSGALEDGHAASTPPLEAWQTLPLPCSQVPGRQGQGPSSERLGSASFLLGCCRPRVRLESGMEPRTPGPLPSPLGKRSAQRPDLCPGDPGRWQHRAPRAVGPSDLSSPLPKRPTLLGHKAPKLGACPPSVVKKARRDKARLLPAGPLPHSRFRADSSLHRTLHRRPGRLMNELHCVGRRERTHAPGARRLPSLPTSPQTGWGQRPASRQHPRNLRFPELEPLPWDRPRGCLDP